MREGKGPMQDASSPVEELISRVRQDLVWSKEDGFLQSVGSGGRVPWSWCAQEVFRLLSEYPQGVTMAVLLCDLQRKWGENNHAWGRSMGGRIGLVQHVHSDQGVPYDGILEVEVSRVRRTGDVLLADICDWRGGRAEWYIPQRFAGHFEAGHMKHCILRMTGLRCTRSKRGGARLLPSELATIVVASKEALMALAGRLEGCMIARVSALQEEGGDDGEKNDAKRRRRNDCVALEMKGGAEGLLVLGEGQSLLKQLMREGDWILLAEPLVVGRGTSGQVLVEYGPSTAIFHHARDAVQDKDDKDDKKSQGDVEESFAERLERIHVGDLEMSGATHVTALVRVTRVQRWRDGCVALELEDPAGKMSPLLCWGRHCCGAGASFHSGQWALCYNLRTARSSRSGALRCHISDEDGGSIIPFPTCGWLASPQLWTPSNLRNAMSGVPSPIAGVLIVEVALSPSTPVHSLCKKTLPNAYTEKETTCPHCGQMGGSTEMVSFPRVRLDDGDVATWVECTSRATQSLLWGRREAHQIEGTRWNVFIVMGADKRLRMDDCIAGVPSQLLQK